MGILRSTYEFLKQASIAHAKWDYEVSMSIIHNRKKMWILLLLLLPIVAVSLADAGSMLGGKTAYAPAFYSTSIFMVSIAIGLAAGLITGCIGAGGGFIITPALMAAGVKGILAVGTDVFHIFAKAIMGTTVHKKLGNVSTKLAMAFLVGSGAGTFIGGAINRFLYDKDPILSEAFISLVYAVLLGFLGVYALMDFWKSRKGTAGGDAHGGPSGTTDFALKLQKIKIPPMISFDEDYVEGGKKISGVFVAMGGAIVGILAAIMGVGGGFLMVPVMVYMLRMPMHVVVGTSLFQILFTCIEVTFLQAYTNHSVDFLLAVLLLVGSTIGAQVGTVFGRKLKGEQLKVLLAAIVLLVTVKIVFELTLTPSLLISQAGGH